MESLKSSDHRKIAEFARELYGLDSVKVISERIVQRIDTLIGGNSALVILNDGTFEAPTVVQAENVGPELQNLFPVMWARRHEHPGFRYHRAYAVRAVTISDLLPFDQWRKTELFNQAYSKLGMQEQIVGVLPHARPDLAGVIVNRSRCTFTGRDRSVLNILRFHISEACRTAKLKATPPSSPLLEALESVVGGSLILLDGTGAVKFCSRLAQDYLETFFATERPFSGRLPLTVEKWARLEIAALETNELALRPPQPLQVLRGDRSLHVRLATANDKNLYFLVFRSEDPALQLKKLSSFGLGPRATEVLYWITKGKTNGEIGILLGVRPRTVEKHVERILSILGVENRLTAALVATQGTV
jgi:DNA-binding CsgD family transcriptional regulator